MKSKSVAQAMKLLQEKGEATFNGVEIWVTWNINTQRSGLRWSPAGSREDYQPCKNKAEAQRLFKYGFEWSDA